MDNKDKIIQYRFTAYLMKSVKNHKSKYIRRKELRQKIETLSGDFIGLLPEKNDFSDSGLLTEGIENAALERALKKLRERDMRILLLHLLEGRSFQEIAKLLGISYKTVFSAYSRTLKKIKNEMEDRGDEFC